VLALKSEISLSPLVTMQRCLTVKIYLGEHPKKITGQLAQVPMDYQQTVRQLEKNALHTAHNSNQTTQNYNLSSKLTQCALTMLKHTPSIKL
jgi:stress response protein SCP2